MLKSRFQIVSVILFIMFLTLTLCAQPSDPPQRENNDADNARQGSPEGKPVGMPPSFVVLDEVTSGAISPSAEFIGSVYFDKTAHVASEVGGIVESVHFDEGEMVIKGQILVSLDSELLTKKFQTKQVSSNQAMIDLEKAKLDFKRTENLFLYNNVSEQKYDDDRHLVQSQEQRLLLIKAELDEIRTELAKKVVVAPFDGVVIEKNVEKGEWLPPGGAVAFVANKDTIDIRVFAPQEILPFIHPGMRVTAYVNRREISGVVLSALPRGDVASRTFPIRIRVDNGDDLKEGMEAKIMLPVGEKSQCLLVPRDAVINKFGMMVAFVVDQNMARMIPVQIIAYQGNYAGLLPVGLAPGMMVVIKGNERIQDGQSVIPTPAK